MDGTAIALPNEQALVARAVAEPEAFAAIYDHYFPRVYNYVRYRVQEASAADDITAQVFERALVKLDSYRAGRGSFAAWLFAIARNAVRDNRRAQSRWRWLSLDGLRDQPGSGPNPEQVVLRDEAHGALLEAVAGLKERERDLIALKFGAEMNNRQIAELTGLSESNVGVILYRAVRRLRRTWSEKEKAHE